MTLIVETTGPLVTVQDLGRPGHADIGVTRGGAVDRAALRLANRLVGNPEGAAGLELLLGPSSFIATRSALVAVTGAPTQVRILDRTMAFGQSHHVPAGARVSVGRAAHGLRSYLAVRGGIRVPTLLGSASSSPTLGLGPAPLHAGTRLEIGVDPGMPPTSAPVPVASWPEELAVDVVLGPRTDWFTAAAVRTLTGTRWRVSSEVDRVGARLVGPVLSRERHGELVSEPLTRGSIQVPPDGQPIVFLADHPTIGGYPVIAVVADADVDSVGQQAPGSGLRFRAVAPPWA